MIKSMTAYSRASGPSALGRLVVEIHSVNRKMLDLSVYLPKDFLRFDIEVRKWLGKFLERGQITFRLNIQDDGLQGNLYSSYLIQLKNLKDKWEKLCRELHYDPKEMIDLPFLVSQLEQPLITESMEEKEILKALKQVVDHALDDLMKMKEFEGGKLVLDIQKRLEMIEESVSTVERKKELPLIFYQNKLIERLKSVGQLQGEAEDRIAREVALLAEKMDVTEEIERLKGHIEQFRLHLLSQEKAIGRTLDFLTQEMHREINTLGSKSSDSEISFLVVRMKSELDKIREQVQNIE